MTSMPISSNAFGIFKFEFCKSQYAFKLNLCSSICFSFKCDFWNWVKAHYNDPLHGVTLYCFPRICMFECIPPQTFERFSQYFCILC